MRLKIEMDALASCIGSRRGGRRLRPVEIIRSGELPTAAAFMNEASRVAVGHAVMMLPVMGYGILVLSVA